MSRAQVQAVSVLEDSRLDADGVLCPEAHDWIARVVTTDDVIEALRRRPEVGRALAARLVIAGPWKWWSDRAGLTTRGALWPAEPDRACAIVEPWGRAFHATAANKSALAPFPTRQQAHQWCDEQLIARGVVLLDELPGGER